MSDAIGAIMRRQSLIRFTGERVDRAAVHGLLEAAVRAPNHHRDQPWRFIVLAGDARAKLGEAFAECARSSGATDAVVEAERAKAFRSPVVIVVACVDTGHPKAIRIEGVEATAAAVENLLIAAEAMGLAAAWRTGPPAHDGGVKRRLGLDPADEIVAFVYLGYPEGDRPPRSERAPVDEVTRWEGWPN